MTDYIVKDTSNGNENGPFDTEEEAEKKRNDFIAMGANSADLKIEERATDGGTDTMGKDGKVEKPVNHAEVVETSPCDEPIADNAGETLPDTDSLAQNPIQFLRGINDEFVNTIRGTPSISKQGFRFIQREFEITTEAEVVQWIDDPVGCIVWARAELSDDYAAEAHGEGYKFESDVSDNEFVRYADSRAKNRAISDLTASGSLAVEELTGGEE